MAAVVSPVISRWSNLNRVEFFNLKKIIFGFFFKSENVAISRLERAALEKRRLEFVFYLWRFFFIDFGVSVCIYCAEASLWVVVAALERTRDADEIVIGGGSHVTFGSTSSVCRTVCR